MQIMTVLRCNCSGEKGKFLGEIGYRVSEDYIEFKCPRCKRVVVFHKYKIVELPRSVKLKKLRCDCEDAKFLCRSNSQGKIAVYCKGCQRIRTFRYGSIVQKYSELPKSIKIDRTGI